MNKTFLFSISLSLFLSCQNSSNKENEKSDSKHETANDSVGNNGIDTLDKSKTNEIVKEEDSLLKVNTNLNISNWKTKDFIIKCPKNYENEVKQLIEYERESWKNVPQPLIATYKGNDIGDYHHINFEDSKKNNFDFGHGKNDFGNVKLYDKDLNDNPKYLNKTFKIYWEWKISTFPCCSGEYEEVEAYLPSITKLEIVE